jgi:hypothetical protein
MSMLVYSGSGAIFGFDGCQYHVAGDNARARMRGSGSIMSAFVMVAPSGHLENGGNGVVDA